ncbi:hypothetical protein [Paraburkholderia sp. RL18-085-BIA-A]|uniref:hypothetical protein n=1 Tax=Paraburkholderia sp. RL18-085-BIA-A TaxID=3031633 RepID=UPI0038BCD498
MSVIFYHLPAAPAVVLPAPVPPAVAWPGATPPGAPLSRLGISIGDIALRAALDIQPNFISPLLPPALLRFFRSALSVSSGTGALTLTVKKSFRHEVPSNWKRIFSETISAGLALTAAEHFADYPFFVPLEFCRPNKSPAGVAWFAANGLVPKSFTVQRSWSGILMPDYVLARQNGTTWEFSTLESKGRDRPVNTSSYGEYSKFKVQSMNAQLSPASGIVGPPPPFTAHFLAVTSLRSSLVSESGRAVRMRWFNHKAPDVNESVPDNWGIEVVAAHYGAHLVRLGLDELGTTLGNAIIGAQTGVDDANVAELRNLKVDPRRFGLRRIAGDSFVRDANAKDFGSPILFDGTFSLIQRIADALVRRDAVLNREISARIFEHVKKTREARTRQDLLNQLIRDTAERGNLTVSSSGIGIISEEPPDVDTKNA